MCSICYYSSFHNTSLMVSFSSSVKPLVPLLSLLENHSSHHGAHDDAQQGAQQQQEDLPACEGRAAEVPGGIVNVVCEEQSPLQICFSILMVFLFWSSLQPDGEARAVGGGGMFRSTFRGLEEADAGLNLGPVQVLLLRGVFNHQLVELHGDDVVVI